jgi:1-deoxy-D-xylulose-5-phosphate synthase
MLFTGYHYQGPAAVRYPRGKATGCALDPELHLLEIGKARELRAGKDVAILVFGTLLQAAWPAAEALNATLVDMRFVKPLDEALLARVACSHRLLVTIEENAVNGGAGSGVNELLQAHDLPVPVLNLGLPDIFLEHGRAVDLLAKCGLDARGIEASIRERLAHLG